MTGISRILVPVDFSPCSKQALEHAVALSERYYGASIDVLHVWDPPRRPGASTPVLDARGAAASLVQETRLQSLKDMETILAEHEAKGIVRFLRLHESGDPVPTILAVARRGDYDLIVMGTHGRTGITHDYLGSVAEKVVRRAPTAVLTIRETAKPPVVRATEKHAGAST